MKGSAELISTDGRRLLDRKKLHFERSIALKLLPTTAQMLFRRSSLKLRSHGSPTPFPSPHSYVPWFPYPSVGVAELEPPNYQTRTTSWDFTNIIPQLSLVMNATLLRVRGIASNRNPELTFHPCRAAAWCPTLARNPPGCACTPPFSSFTDITRCRYDTTTWDYPADPNVVDFNYPRGNAVANTTQMVGCF